VGRSRSRRTASVRAYDCDNTPRADRLPGASCVLRYGKGGPPSVVFFVVRD